MADTFRTGYWHYYAQLQPHMQKVYMSIYRGLYNKNSDFTFQAEAHNGVYPPPEMVSNIVDYVLRDNPALYYVNLTNVKVYASQQTGTIRVAFTDYYPFAEHQLMEIQLHQRAQPIVDMLLKQKDIHVRMHKLYRYVIGGVAADRRVTKTDTQKNTEARSIVGPLIHHKAVCGGYANVIKLLCDQVGISCFVLHGPMKTAKGWENHAWNVVWLDGHFYHLDAAYGAGSLTGKEYYLRGDAKMHQDRKWDAAICRAERDYR